MHPGKRGSFVSFRAGFEPATSGSPRVASKGRNTYPGNQTGLYSAKAYILYRSPGANILNTKADISVIKMKRRQFLELLRYGVCLAQCQTNTEGFRSMRCDNSPPRLNTHRYRYNLFSLVQLDRERLKRFRCSIQECHDPSYPFQLQPYNWRIPHINLYSRAFRGSAKAYLNPHWGIYLRFHGFRHVRYRHLPRKHG